MTAIRIVPDVLIYSGWLPRLAAILADAVFGESRLCDLASTE
jgi:hypothetical protein